MWNCDIDLQTKSITFRRSSRTMTGVPVLTIWRRHCHILPFKGATIFILQSFLPTIRYRYMTKYSQIPSWTPPALSWRAIFPPCITTGTSFERNPCLWSEQKHQIDLTQRCIRRFRNSQLWTAIPGANWRWMGTRGLWTGAQKWSKCTCRQHICYTPQWAVVLPSTISLPYICWASGT